MKILTEKGNGELEVSDTNIKNYRSMPYHITKGFIQHALCCARLDALYVFGLTDLTRSETVDFLTE